MIFCMLLLCDSIFAFNNCLFLENHGSRKIAELQKGLASGAAKEVEQRLVGHVSGLTKANSVFEAKQQEQTSNITELQQKHYDLQQKYLVMEATQKFLEQTSSDQMSGVHMLGQHTNGKGWMGSPLQTRVHPAVRGLRAALR